MTNWTHVVGDIYIKICIFHVTEVWIFALKSRLKHDMWRRYISDESRPEFKACMSHPRLERQKGAATGAIAPAFQFVVNWSETRGLKGRNIDKQLRGETRRGNGTLCPLSSPHCIRFYRRRVHVNTRTIVLYNFDDNVWSLKAHSRPEWDQKLIR